MASSIDFIEYICEQIEKCGYVRFKKMFGEYMVYLNDKPIFLVCDNTLFVKISDKMTEILGEDAEREFPYEGAGKEYFVISDVENREFMQNLAFELEKITPLPKPKKKKI